MPPTSDRVMPIELLLCAHHLRASRRGLAAAAAVLCDAAGAVIEPPAPTPPTTQPATRRPAALSDVDRLRWGCVRG